MFIALRLLELPRRATVMITIIIWINTTLPNVVLAGAPNQPSRHSEPWIAFPELPPGATRQELYVNPSLGPVYMYVRTSSPDMRDCTVSGVCPQTIAFFVYHLTDRLMCIGFPGRL